MKRAHFIFIFLINAILFVLFFTGCSEDLSGNSIVEIEMPHDNYYYETENWTLESLITHLKDLGFSNIKTVSYSATEYEPSEVRSISIGYELGFDEGDVFRSSDKVTITYFTFEGFHTIDNCPALADILSGKSFDYVPFAEQYDGVVVEFDAVVTHSSSYLGGTGHIIEVCGGDIIDNSQNKQAIRVCLDVPLDRYINKDVQEGDLVHIVGTVSARDSDYFDMLYIDASYFKKR